MICRQYVCEKPDFAQPNMTPVVECDNTSRLKGSGLEGSGMEGVGLEGSGFGGSGFEVAARVSFDPES